MTTDRKQHGDLIVRAWCHLNVAALHHKLQLWSTALFLVLRVDKLGLVH